MKNKKLIYLSLPVLILPVGLVACDKDSDEKNNDFDKLKTDDSQKNTETNKIQDNVKEDDNSKENNNQEGEESTDNSLSFNDKDVEPRYDYTEEEEKVLINETNKLKEESPKEIVFDKNETTLFKDVKWYSDKSIIEKLMKNNNIKMTLNKNTNNYDLEYNENIEYLPKELQSIYNVSNNHEYFLKLDKGAYYSKTIVYEGTDIQDESNHFYDFGKELFVGYGVDFKSDKSLNELRDILKQSIGEKYHIYIGTDLQQEVFYINGTNIVIYDLNNGSYKIEVYPTSTLLVKHFNIKEGH